MIPFSIVFSFVIAAVVTVVAPIIILIVLANKKKNKRFAIPFWCGGILPVTDYIAYATHEHSVRTREGK